MKLALDIALSLALNYTSINLIYCIDLKNQDDLMDLN